MLSTTRRAEPLTARVIHMPSNREKSHYKCQNNVHVSWPSIADDAENPCPIPTAAVYQSDSQTVQGVSVDSIDVLPVPACDNSAVQGVKACRKRRRCPENWKHLKRKKLRNSGEEYFTKHAKFVEAKVFRGLPGSCCKHQCYDKLSEEACFGLFKQFWSTGSHDIQTAFIAGCISQQQVSKHSVKTVQARNGFKFRRTSLRKFSLPVSDEVISVCKTMFCAVFGISHSRVHRVLVKQRENGGLPGTDKRGKYDHCKQRISPEAAEYVKSHISSFPVNESHYTRSHSFSRRYLSPDLSITKMYNMYVAKCCDSGRQPVKVWAYRNIFNTHFNLCFHVPRKDTCKKCDMYKAQAGVETTTEKRRQLEMEHELHLRKADAVRQCLKNESKKCNGSPIQESFTFDLQKVLSVPRLTTSEAYYCRQVSVYNLGIHNLSTGEGLMHVWDETVASRGAEEISSCLLKYCSDRAASGVQVINAFSDACGGQNRNFKVVLISMYLCLTTDIVEINHRFMISGHSYLPNDADFGVIERATVKTDIFVPEQWCEVIKKCKRSSNKFQVVPMKPELFKSVSKLAKAVTVRKTTEDGSKVEWMKIQWISIRKSEPLKMFFKYTVQDDAVFSCVSFKKMACGQTEFTDPLTQLYEQQPRALSQEKVKDAKKLLKYVPQVYHLWYCRLEANTVDTAIHMYEDELLGQSDVKANEADQEVTSVSDEVLPQHTVASAVFSVDFSMPYCRSQPRRKCRAQTV